MSDATEQAANRYLLGEMTDEERDAFELQFMADGALSETVAAVEADLLDAYVREELDAGQRQRVEQHLIATPAQKQRLVAARMLRTALERRRPAARRSWWAAAAAAALAAIVTAAVTFFPRESRKAGPVTPVASTPPTPRRAQAETPAPPEIEPREPVVVTVVLASVITRGDGGGESVALPPETDTLRLVIGLQSGDEEFSSYRAVVQGVQGNVVTERDRLVVTPDGAVKVDISARALRPDDYEVLVDGVPASGAPEPLGVWAFAVKR